VPERIAAGHGTCPNQRFGTARILELQTHVAWDGKERRKPGRTEELRVRIDKLRSEWDAERRQPERKPKRRSNSLRKK
jgi:hypothetical protein